MAALGEHTHHIKIRSTQMEMASSGASGRDEDYDRKLKEAQTELDRIQLQRKRAFLTQQVELSEKLTSSLTLIDRELFEMRQEADDLEQCRVCFAAHLDKIQKFNPETWTRDQLSEKLEKSSMAIDIASDEYDQAAAHFENSRSGAIFGRPSKRGRAAAHRGNLHSDFALNLRNGFAFNLPLVVLGGVALFVYLVR
mgnify:CR=1 FL=1